MRQLLPSPADDVDPVTAYLAATRPLPEGRPWVVAGMIASLDGATAIEGRSGALGGPADKAVFRAVRALADVIVVAAGTVRSEGYGPVRFSDEVRDARIAAGRSPEPPTLAIVTGSLDLDLDGELFTTEGSRPIVLTTTDADPDRVAEVADVADVRQLGVGRVDLAAAMRSLRDEGREVVVSEGGPGFNGALVDAGLVDEWCVSIAPVVAGGDSRRIVHGADAVQGDAGLRLDSLLEGDGILFGRWVRG